MKKDVLSEAKVAFQAKWLAAERKFDGATIPPEYSADFTGSYPAHNGSRPATNKGGYRFPTTADTAI